jgi:hypothetical protein
VGAINDAITSATKAVRFDRIVVVGLLVILALIVSLSFALPLVAPAESKTVEFTLAFFKDIALILVGALANSVRHKSADDAQEG